MTLTDIKGLGPKLAATLGKDGWTVEGVATATATKLQKYRGVSYNAAQEIIDSARQLVNEKGLEESQFQPSAGPPDQPPASARVKRIRNNG